MADLAFLVGAHVRATRDIRGLFRILVRCGTTGTVVRGGNFGAVMVCFDNGPTMEISKTSIEVLPAPLR